MTREFYRLSPAADPEWKSGLSREQLGLLERALQQEAMDGHTLIAACLQRLGVTHVYSVSGTPVEQTLAACAAAGIRLIGVHHQQAGALMAAAQNYSAGRLVAVNILSAGPGVTNVATGILVAHDNGWPLVVLGGRRPLNMSGSGNFQDLDAVPIFRSITKWSALVESTQDIPRSLERAFRIATDGRPGPVYLDIPEEALNGVGPLEPTSVTDREDLRTSGYDPAVISTAASILLSATRPLVVLGKGLRWQEAFSEARQLVELLGIPFVTSPMARGFIPDSHHLCFNAASRYAQSDADAVCVLGARLDWAFRFGAEFAPDARLIHVDVHPEEIGRNRQPDAGIVGEPKHVVQQLLGELEARPEVTARPVDLQSWVRQLGERRRENQEVIEAMAVDETLPMSPHRMARELRECISTDTICVLDGNVSMAAAQQVIPGDMPVSRFTAGTNGCMGVGIPFGIAAKLTNPDRPVIVISGDTAFGFNAMDMETAVRHQIPVIVIVVNNEGISGGLKQAAFYPPDYPERVTMFQPGIRYERIVQALGGYGEFVAEPDQLAPAIVRAQESGKAACINVSVNPHAPYPAD